ncbi:hypothetical protein [Actinoplanes sp. NPDC023714]|uniref:hypothetical protein n=1 Tax=Actinoplanes sp. NPDC023714 TaxID=3154322 RepID=UPI0033F155B2
MIALVSVVAIGPVRANSDPAAAGTIPGIQAGRRTGTADGMLSSPGDEPRDGVLAGGPSRSRHAPSFAGRHPEADHSQRMTRAAAG